MIDVINIRKYNGEYLYVGRGSKWGNPFTSLKQKRLTAEQNKRLISCKTKSYAIASYQRYIVNNVDLVLSLRELKGQTLGCFCKPSTCHADVLSNLYLKLNIENLCQQATEKTIYSQMASVENS